MELTLTWIFPSYHRATITYCHTWIYDDLCNLPKSATKWLWLRAVRVLAGFLGHGASEINLSGADGLVADTNTSQTPTPAASGSHIWWMVIKCDKWCLQVVFACSFTCDKLRHRLSFDLSAKPVRWKCGIPRYLNFEPESAESETNLRMFNVSITVATRATHRKTLNICQGTKSVPFSFLVANIG